MRSGSRVSLSRPSGCRRFAAKRSRSPAASRFHAHAHGPAAPSRGLRGPAAGSPMAHAPPDRPCRSGPGWRPPPRSGRLPPATAGRPQQRLCESVEPAHTGCDPTTVRRRRTSAGAAAAWKRLHHRRATSEQRLQLPVGGFRDAAADYPRMQYACTALGTGLRRPSSPPLTLLHACSIFSAGLCVMPALRLPPGTPG